MWGAGRASWRSTASASAPSAARRAGPGYAGATDRYEIFITGGANNVAVGTR